MKDLIFILMPLLLVSCSGKNVPLDPDVIETEGFEVVAVSDRPPFGSGIFSVLVEVKSETRRGRPFDLFLQYFREQQTIPKPGDTCFAKIRFEFVSGNSTLNTPSDDTIRHFITDDIKCSAID
jgi:hypothetical protein